MKIDPKATKADLVKIIHDLRDEATGWHQRAKILEDQLDELVDKTGDNKPWLLAGVSFAAGAIVASIAWTII